MISIGSMGIELASLGSIAAPPQAPATAPSDSGGFESHLSACESSGAPPPGNPPPVQNEGEKELKTSEPNAQSQKPDLSSQSKEKTAERSNDAANGKDAKSSSGDKTDKSKSGGQVSLNAEVASLVGNSASFATNLLPTAASAKPSDKPALAVAKTASDKQVSLSELPTSAKAEIVDAKATYATEQPVAPAPATPAIDMIPTEPARTPVEVTSAATRQPQTAAPSDSMPSSPAVNQGTAPPEPVPTPVSQTQDLQISAGPASAPETKPAPHAQIPTVAATTPSAHAARTAEMGANFSSNTHSQTNQNGGQLSQNSQKQPEATDLLRQITDHADKLAAAKAVENVTVHLQSEDDTNITLTVKANHAGVQAQIVTNSEGLRSALHQNRSDLDRAFQNKGMNLGQLSVGLKDSKEGGQQHEPRSRNAEVLAQQTEQKAPRLTTYRSGAGVDIAI